MPEPIFFLSHFRIKEGQLDVVRRIASKGAARLQAEKPRTVLFLSYLDADGETISRSRGIRGPIVEELYFRQVRGQRHDPDGGAVVADPIDLDRRDVPVG
jgi:hypothetical protein